MGSKRFTNKKCVYCGGSATTGDHVVARTFFPDDHRDGLPLVPACEECNCEKSKLEHYLGTVLPLAGNHSAALTVLENGLHRKLGKNVALREELERGFEQCEQVTPGLHSTTLRATSLSAYSRFVTLGLLFHHFGESALMPSDARGGALPHSRSKAFDEMYSQVAPVVTPVEGVLAFGALQYRGFAAKNDPRTSFWQVRLYGGLNLGGDLYDGSGKLLDRYDLMGMTLHSAG